MYLYNVTISVIKKFSEEWLLWMKNEHIPDLISTGLITRARLFELDDKENTAEDAYTFVAQYELPNKTAYLEYLDNHAHTMRQKGLDKFGDKFIAFRTSMQLLHESQAD